MKKRSTRTAAKCASGKMKKVSLSSLSLLITSFLLPTGALVWVFRPKTLWESFGGGALVRTPFSHQRSVFSASVPR